MGGRAQGTEAALIMPKRKPGAHRLNVRELFLDLVICFAGSIIYAISVTFFTAPNKIAPGGITGISTVLHYLIGTPIGIMILILNIPLFILGLRFIGGPFMIKSILCTALTSFAVDGIDALLVILKPYGIQPYHGNDILVALYGGVLSGAGLALVFLRGATTGGTDIASRLLKLKFAHISMGRMMMTIDAVVIIFSAVVFRSVDSALYAMIAIFTSSRVIDSILYGSDTGRMAVIISRCNDEIARTILRDMHRGITVLKGRGFYTGEERDVLICAVRRAQAVRIRQIVRRGDPTAFIIMCEAGEVIGEGFKPINNDM